MARKPTPPRGETAPPRKSPAPAPAKAAAPAPAKAAAPAAPAPRVTVAPPKTSPPAAASGPRTPAQPATPAAAALSAADIKIIRDRLEAFTPDTPAAAAATPTTADGIVAIVAEKLKEARAADAARIKALEDARAADAERIRTLDAKAADTAGAADAETDAALRDALETTDVLLAEVARLRSLADGQATELATLKAGAERTQREIAELRAAQKPTRDGAQVLGAETVASLLDDFVGSFRSRLGALQVSSGDVLLKAGFTALGDGAGFVLPSATAPAADQPALHEIRLRLDPKR